MFINVLLRNKFLLAFLTAVVPFLLIVGFRQTFPVGRNSNCEKYLQLAEQQQRTVTMDDVRQGYKDELPAWQSALLGLVEGKVCSLAMMAGIAASLLFILLPQVPKGARYWTLLGALLFISMGAGLYVVNTAKPLSYCGQKFSLCKPLDLPMPERQ